MPGAKKAAGKAYSSCDPFKLEPWISDRVVLLVENSLAGSIHRNYDLLLRHYLHIVCKVKLPIRLSVDPRRSTGYFSPLPWIDKNPASLMDS